MLSMPGILSPLARPASKRSRAISGRVNPRASRWWRSHRPGSSGITRSLRNRRSRISAFMVIRPSGRWHPESRVLGLAQEVVSDTGFGAFDKSSDFGGLENEGGAVGVGRLADSDLAAGEFLCFEAGAAVVAPGFAPAVVTEVGGGHAVADDDW